VRENDLGKILNLIYFLRSVEDQKWEIVPVGTKEQICLGGENPTSPPKLFLKVGRSYKIGSCFGESYLILLPAYRRAAPPMPSKSLSHPGSLLSNILSPRAIPLPP